MSGGHEGSDLVMEDPYVLRVVDDRGHNDVGHCVGLSALCL